MSFFKKVSILILLQGFMQAQIFAEICNKSSEASNKNGHTVIEHHPAGPVIRKTWLDPLSNLPHKIEISRLGSGGFLLNGIKLFHQKVTGSWHLESENNELQLLIKNQSQNTNKLITISEGCKWEIEVTSEHLPKPIIGIATEDEPNLNLLLTKQNCS